jgi:hypothetical protein
LGEGSVRTEKPGAISATIAGVPQEKPAYIEDTVEMLVEYLAVADE